MIANTFFQLPIDELVTCYNVGQFESENISWQSHSQIDFALCSKDWMHCVQDVRSDRRWPLASHHYPLVMELDINVPKQKRANSRQHAAVSSLATPATANRFAALFEANMAPAMETERGDVNSFYACFLDSFAATKIDALPCRPVVPERPWISGQTLDLLEARCEGQRLHQYHYVK